MKRGWIAVALLAASWLLGTNLYHAPNGPAWVVLVSLGGLLLVGVVDRLPGRRAAAGALVFLVPGVLVMPWPDRVAVVLMASGLVLLVVPIPRRWPKVLGMGAVLAGAVLLAQAAGVLAYTSLTARSHDLPFPLPHVLGVVASLLGLDAAVDGSTVAVFGMRQVQRFGATWELLLDPVSLGLLVGGLVLVLVRAWSVLPEKQRLRGAVRPVLALAGLMAVWLPVRAGLLMALYMHRMLRTGYDDPLDLMGQFWNPWVHLALGLVPAVTAWRLVRVREPDEVAQGEEGVERGYPLAATVLVAVGVFAVTFGLLWCPAGERKTRRVTVDDLHSGMPWPAKTFDTTRTDRPFDTEWYGHESAYNLSCLYDYCSRFYEMSRLDGEIDAGRLSGCDVLVLKVPSAPYAKREIEAIRQWVEQGGGLLLIGEHTTVYGSSVNLNAVARPFGFAFRPDCLFGIDSWFDERYTPPLVPHPVIQRMGPLEFAVSCSIDPGASPGTAVIRGTGLKNLGPDYHAVNFYPQPTNRADMRYGAFVQLWATSYGRGRVLAFTDSTILANFSAFEPGKSEMFLGMLEWLNHRGPVFDPAPWMVRLGLVLVLVGLVFGRSWTDGWLVMVAAGVLGWAVAAAGAREVNRWAMPLPEPLRPMVRVGLDRTVSEAPLPKSGFIAGKDGHFGQFERSILRLGYFTYRAEGPDVFRGDVVVVPYPSRESPAFRDRLAAYVAGGGKVLVLDDPENKESSANALLRPFGLAVKRPETLRGTLGSPAGWPAVTLEAACPVEGGTPLADVEGRPVAACARHGEGAVVVLGFGSRFTDANMGVTGDVVPDAALRKVFDLEFAILRAMVEDRLPAGEANAAPTQEE